MSLVYLSNYTKEYVHKHVSVVFNLEVPDLDKTKKL